MNDLVLTSPARTAYDLLRDADTLTAIYACESALRFGLVTHGDLRAFVDDSRTPGTAGASVARTRFQLLAPASESPLETAGRLVLIGAGLPVPDVQVPVHDLATGDLLFRLDLGYPALRIGIELDGRLVHGQPDTIMADRRRQNALHLMGWTLLRFTWSDVMHRPRYVVATVRRALATAA